MAVSYIYIKHNYLAILVCKLSIHMYVRTYIHECHWIHFNCYIQTLTTVAPPNIRLVGGSNEYEGRLEIFWNGVWGTVCDDGFGNVDAAVACRQLGYSADNAIAFGNGYFGQGNGTIWLDDVQCEGNENFLFQCPAADFGDHNCAHFEDVGIRCGGNL